MLKARTYVVGLILVSSMPLILLAMLLVSELLDEKRKDVSRQVLQRTEAFANAVQRRLEVSWSALTILASDPVFDTPDFSLMYEHAQRLVRDVDHLGQGIALVDEPGTLLFSTRAPFGTKLPQLPDPESAAKVFATAKPYLSPLFFGPMTRTNTVSLNQPIIRNGRVIYDLRLAIGAAELGRVIAEQTFPADWRAAIIDQNGAVIARNRDPGRSVAMTAPADLLDAIAQQGAGGMAVRTRDGLSLWATFSRVPGANWTVIVAAPLDFADTILASSISRIAATVAVLLAVSMMLALAFANRLSRSLGLAAKAADALGRGEPPAPIPSRVFEISRLNLSLIAAHLLLSSREAALKEAGSTAEAARVSAEMANAAKSKFLAAISHDLRQPVQSLLLFLELLSRSKDMWVREIGGYMNTAVLGLKQMLDEFLDMSKLDAGAVHPSIRDVDLATITEEIDVTMRPIAQEKGLRLQTCNCHCLVQTDPILLARLLRNLVHNAIRYTVEGGVTIDCVTDRDWVTIEVSDTGIGIPAESLEEIFYEFHQLNNAERDREKGLGLGLSIAKRIAQLLNLPLGVRSRLGQGSTFSVGVPLAATNSNSAEAAVSGTV